MERPHDAFTGGDTHLVVRILDAGVELVWLVSVERQDGRLDPSPLAEVESKCLGEILDLVDSVIDRWVVHGNCSLSARA